MNFNLKPLSEKEFQGQIVKAARLLGWLVYHTYDSRHSVPGFPDLCMARPPRLIFAELKKNEKEKPTEEQEKWIAAINGVPGTACYVWRPADWPEIEKVLR